MRKAHRIILVILLTISIVFIFGVVVLFILGTDKTDEVDTNISEKHQNDGTIKSDLLEKNKRQQTKNEINNQHQKSQNENDGLNETSNNQNWDNNNNLQHYTPCNLLDLDFYKLDFGNHYNTCFMNVFVRLAVLFNLKIENENILNDNSLFKSIHNLRKLLKNKKVEVIDVEKLYLDALNIFNKKDQLNSEMDALEFLENFASDCIEILENQRSANIFPYVKEVYNNRYEYSCLPIIYYDDTYNIKSFKELLILGIRNTLQRSKEFYHNETQKRIYFETGQIVTIMVSKSGKLEKEGKCDDFNQYSFKSVTDLDEKELIEDKNFAEELIEKKQVEADLRAIKRALEKEAGENNNQNLESDNNLKLTPDHSMSAANFKKTILPDLNQKSIMCEGFIFKLKAAIVYHFNKNFYNSGNHYAIYIFRNGKIYLWNEYSQVEIKDEKTIMELISENGLVFTYEITDKKAHK